MRAFSWLGLLLTALLATAATAQLTIPQIVQLPTEDFAWNWGTRSGSFEGGQRRPDFSIKGVEQNFWCTLTGAFRPGSRMRDFENLRDFEQSLSSTLYFIQDVTYALNDLYRANQVDWATLDCAIPETQESDDKSQERLDRAVERALRDRERRRQRAESADD